MPYDPSIHLGPPPEELRAKMLANRPQARGRRRKWPLLGVCAAVMMMIAVLAGCQVGDTFKLNGDTCMVEGQNQFVCETQEHVDVPAITATDKFCALSNACPFWDRPKYHFWHLPVYHDFVGSWVTTEGDWEMWGTCDYYNPEAWCASIAVGGVRG